MGEIKSTNDVLHPFEGRLTSSK